MFTRELGRIAVTLSPIALLATVFGLGMSGYWHELHSDLETVTRLSGLGVLAGAVFVPIWTAIRAKRAWVIQLFAQHILLGLQLVVFIAAIATTPNGQQPPRCISNLVAAVVFLGMIFVGYVVLSVPATAFVEKISSKSKLHEAWSAGP